VGNQGCSENCLKKTEHLASFTSVIFSSKTGRRDEGKGKMKFEPNEGGIRLCDKTAGKERLICV